ncbi:hypothetical protein DPMN_093770 [Dreissena polymorpha]|uniref:Uncharacterized protein n=1 Tax=Dreissena polymorpha TaxID=45954 RepID=A0A9D4L4H3_DREPO|nr:hypothetical protein DPMN_093770 [Dreissena polymorpha]
MKGLPRVFHNQTGHRCLRNNHQSAKRLLTLTFPVPSETESSRDFGSSTTISALAKIWLFHLTSNRRCKKRPTSLRTAQRGWASQSK